MSSSAKPSLAIRAVRSEYYLGSGRRAYDGARSSRGMGEETAWLAAAVRTAGCFIVSGSETMGT